MRVGATHPDYFHVNEVLVLHLVFRVTITTVALDLFKETARGGVALNAIDR
jgi:hypothetical protein